MNCEKVLTPKELFAGFTEMWPTPEEQLRTLVWALDAEQYGQVREKLRLIYNEMKQLEEFSSDLTTLDAPHTPQSTIVAVPSLVSPAPKPDIIKVDLKWWCWSMDHEPWTDYAPGVWDRLATLPCGATLTVKTAPRKHLRFGDVALTHRADGDWGAHAAFWSEFDEGPGNRVERPISPVATFEKLME